MRLNVDTGRATCEALAKQIAARTMGDLDGLTTVSVERAVLRLLGMNGGEGEQPHVNDAVDNIDVSKGALYAVACVLSKKAIPLDQAFEQVRLGNIPNVEPQPLAVEYLRIVVNTRLSQSQQAKRAKPIRTETTPLSYLIVATGDIVEDAKQAYAAAVAGADIIAVIRSTAQSLLDYVPVGLTRVGFGGTYATYENFEHVRKALDKAEEVTGRRKYLTNYASGLCMPEIAACASLTGLDMLLNDSMYGILFRDINPRRTFIDQHFSRQICTRADIIINTGEDNYLTTADAIDKAHTVTASQFINRAFAHLSGMPDRLLGLGHAYEIEPSIENSMLTEIAHALLARELFPDCPLKYMPPTKHKCGDIFFSHAHDTMYNLVSVLTRQSIHLVGILTEAIHTPFIQDRMYSLDSTSYVFNAANLLSQQLDLNPDSYIAMRARQVLEEATNMLTKVDEVGMWQTMAEGQFADVKRPELKGKGLDGVITKAPEYLELFV